MTDTQRSISRQYLVYRMLTNMWFISAVWLYFYRIFITDQQVGFLDGFAFAVGLLAEVPSGALADRIGRDRLTKLGHILAGTGLLVQAFGSSFVPFFVGQSIVMIGVSFASGADEALFFQNLQFKRDSKTWRKLVTRGSQFALLGSVIATAVGGLMHTVNPRLPWILTGVAFVLGALSIWKLSDTRSASERNEQTTSALAHYVADIRSGFAAFGQRKLLLYVPLILSVQGILFAAGFGLLRIVLLDRFGFSPLAGSVLIASCALATALLLQIVHRNADRISEKKMLTLITLMVIASLLMSVPEIGMYGAIIMLAIYASEHLLSPYMSEILNYQATEKQRATVLSVASFLKTLPYVLLAPVIGYLNASNTLEYFLLGWAAICMASLVYYLSQKKKDISLQL